MEARQRFHRGSCSFAPVIACCMRNASSANGLLSHGAASFDRVETKIRLPILQWHRREHRVERAHELGTAHANHGRRGRVHIAHEGGEGEIAARASRPARATSDCRASGSRRSTLVSDAFASSVSIPSTRSASFVAWADGSPTSTKIFSMCSRYVAQPGRGGIRARVIVTVRKSEAALLERENLARAVLEIGLGAGVEHDRYAALLESSDLVAESRRGCDRVNRGELRLEWRRALPLDRRRVHARRIVDARFACRVIARALRRIFEHLVQHLVAAVGDFSESAERGVRGGDLGALEPAAVRVRIEVRARVAGGVDVRAVEGVRRRLCLRACGRDG